MKTKRKRIWMTTILASLFLAAFMGGCKKDDYVETVGVCPLVLSTIPADGATLVPLNQVISATFNEKMDPATITQASFTLQGATKASVTVSGTVTYNEETSTISFVPTTLLSSNTTYTGMVKTSVKDLMGNALQTDYIWTFATGETLSPKVISTDPADLATGVVLNKTVTATFSVPMDPSTINASTFTLKQGTTSVAGTVSYIGSTSSFIPSGTLAPNTQYTATITTGAKNIAGIPLLVNYVWTFTTGSVTAPSVILTSPLDNASNVALNTSVTATFNMPMDLLTITTSTFTLKAGAATISGVVSYAGSMATFTPNSDLSTGTTYTATITTGAKNPAGIALANKYVWNFSTGVKIDVPTGVDLKSADQFGILAGVGVSNNAGFSEIRNLNVGIYPGARSSVTGFPPAKVVNGVIYAADDLAPAGVPALLIQAKQDLVDAYLFAEGAVSPAPATVAGDQGGKTLAPGIYKSTSTLLIQSGNLTLDAQGDVNAVWIFQIASDFTTVGGAGGSVVLSGGAQAKNVYWQTGRSATIGDYTNFYGNILALTSITMNSHATAVGRMLARNGSVVMTHTNIIEKP